MAIPLTAQNFRVYRGTSVSMPFTAETSTSISGWLLGFNVHRGYGDLIDAVIKKEIGTGITVTNASIGSFTIALSADDTDLPSRAYLWSLWRIDASPNRRVLARGTMTILPIDAHE